MAVFHLGAYLTVNRIDRYAYTQTAAKTTERTYASFLLEIDGIVRCDVNAVSITAFIAKIAVKNVGVHGTANISYTNRTGSACTNTGKTCANFRIGEILRIRRLDIGLALQRNGFDIFRDCFCCILVFYHTYSHGHTCAYSGNTCHKTGHIDIGFMVSIDGEIIRRNIEIFPPCAGFPIEQGYTGGIGNACANSCTGCACRQGGNSLTGRSFYIQAAYVSRTGICIAFARKTSLRQTAYFIGITTQANTGTLTSKINRPHQTGSIGIIMRCNRCCAFGTANIGVIDLSLGRTTYIIYVDRTIDCRSLSCYTSIDQEGFYRMCTGSRNRHAFIRIRLALITQTCLRIKGLIIYTAVVDILIIHFILSALAAKTNATKVSIIRCLGFDLAIDTVHTDRSTNGCPCYGYGQGTGIIGNLFIAHGIKKYRAFISPHFGRIQNMRIRLGTDIVHGYRTRSSQTGAIINAAAHANGRDIGKTICFYPDIPAINLTAFNRCRGLGIIIGHSYAGANSRILSHGYHIRRSDEFICSFRCHLRFRGCRSRLGVLIHIAVFQQGRYILVGQTNCRSSLYRHFPQRKSHASPHSRQRRGILRRYIYLAGINPRKIAIGQSSSIRLPFLIAYAIKGQRAAYSYTF